MSSETCRRAPRRNSRFAAPAMRPICAAALLACGTAWALPQGATVVNGQASVANGAARVDITQTTSKAAIDWKSFSIGRNETVKIVQPGTDSVLLNRVTGVSPSVLLGQLQANGRVYLSNPRGIIFGAGGQVDVGGLVATTLSIDDAALRAGRFDLTRGIDTPGAIEVAGDIRASGTVALVAPTLSVASGGRITAPRIGLAAATAVTVDVEGDGLIFFNMSGDDAASRLQMLGELRADGGTAELRAAARAGFADTVLNLEGIVQARTLGVREGRVVIDGGSAGIVRVAGQVDATGTQAGQHGGAVDVLGDRVLIDATARIDASGAAGGGSLRVGGDYQGANAEVHNARRVAVQQGAELRADALAAGDGGRVIVWSDEATAFAGSISARGGAQGGDGGFAEVSGKRFLDYRGMADLGAAAGAGGRLLLDPLNLTIGGTANINGDGTPGDNLSSLSIAFGDFAGANSQITAAALVSQLQTGGAGGTPGAVELQATNDITVSSAVSANAGSLTLRAGNNITVSATLAVAGGVALHANDNTGGTATGTGAANITAAVSSSAGAVVVDSLNSSGTSAINATLTGTSVTLNGNAALAATIASTVVNINGGTVTLGANDRLANNAAVAVATGATLSMGTFTDTVGSLSLAGALSGNGTLTAASYALNGGLVQANLGAGDLTSIGNSTITGNAAVSTAEVVSGVLSVGNGGATGALGGTRTVDAGATLRYNLTGPVAVGALAGTGTLEQAGSGVMTIGQAISVSAVNVTGTGTVALGAADVLDDGASVSVSNAAGTFDLGAFTDTVGSLSLAGTLAGSGTLTAATYALNGGQVQANLGAGALTSDGASLITGNAGVTSAVVQTGTLSIGNGGAGGTLAGSRTVNNGATLRYNVTGSVAVGALAGTGTLEQAGSGVMTIGQAISVSAVNVTGTGTVALGAADVLDNGASVSVSNAAGIFDLGTFSDTVGSLALSGTLAGTGTLTAGTYTLTGATVNGNLGTGTLGSTGATTLNGTSAATAVNVNGGTLALGASDRLADGAAVTVAAGATLSTGAGFTDTVGSLAMNGTAGNAATLGGTGTMTAATYTVADATLNANLGAGTFSSTGATALNGTLGATTVNVNGGTLTLGASDRLANTAAVSVAAGATLALGAFNDTVGTLALNGTAGNTATLSGTGTLTASAVGVGVTNYVLSEATVGANLGTGTLVSTGTTALNGTAGATTVDINGGTLTLGASDRLANTAVVNVAAGATLALGAFNDTVGTLALNGTAGNTATLSGSGTLSASSLTSDGDALITANVNATTALVQTGTLSIGNGGASGSLAGNRTVSSGATLRYNVSGPVLLGAVAGTGTLEQAGSGVLTVDQAVSISTVNVTGSGTVALGASNLIANTTVIDVGANGTLALGTFSDTIGSLTLAGALTGTGTLTAATYTLTGATVSGNLGAGALTSTGNTALNGTSGATTVDIDGGTLALGASDRLANTATVNVAAGATLALGAFNDTVGTLALNGTAGNTATLSGTGTLTASAVGVGVTNYVLSEATVGANLGTGTLVSTGTTALNGTAGATTVDINGGTLTLGASDRLANTAVVNVAAGATLALGTFSDTVGTLALNGTAGNTATLSGSGTLSASSLTSDGDALITANVNATTALVQTGTLSIGNGGASGSLAGNRTVSSGATLRYNVSGPVLLGAVAGTGTLEQAGSGVLTVDQAVSISTVNVTGSGTVALGASNLIANTTVIDVGANGTLALGTFSDTIGSLTLAGALTGTGTLTAATYTLAGATVTGNLGAGILHSTGATALAGTAGAGVVNIDAGTLTLGAANRLADTAAVNVAAGATLALGTFNDTVGTLALNGTAGNTATLSGTGTLTASAAGAGVTNYVLNNATVNANLGTGSLASTGNTALNGTAGATTVNLNSGTLTLGASDRLANTAAVTVAAGATLALGAFNDTVGTLTLNGTAGSTATLSGTGTLTASAAGVGVTNYALNNATVNANLGTGTLTSTGATALNGTAGATTVGVNSGTLTLGASDRLANTAAVTVAAGATLALGAFNDTVGALTLNGMAGSTATLSGTGTLTAANYGLNNATVDANLGTGTLTSAGATALNGTAGATTIAINSGTLTLGASNRLADTAAVTVAAGATLALGTFDDTVGTLTLNGTAGSTATLSGTGTLAASAAGVTNYNLNNATVEANLGAGTLASAGETTLQGITSATTIGVTAGRLTLSAANALADTADVTVATGATLRLGGAETIGSLAGGGTVTMAGALTTGASRSSRFDGTLDGSGDLHKQGSATNFTLGGTASFAGATSVEAGTLTLEGTLASSTVSVGTGGTLALALAERLADGAAVSVASGATLAMAGFDDTVGSLALQGTLSGTGTLTAATYGLDGARVDANLGTGALRSSGATLLNGTAAASAVSVDAGSLTLGAAGRLTGVPAVTLATAGSTLVLGGAETLGSLSGTGTVNLGAHTLSTGIAGGSQFDGTLTGSQGSTLVKQGTGTFVLAGNNAYDATAIEAGTLQVGAGGTSGTLGSGAVNNAGTLRFNRSDALQVAAPIVGAGGLEQAGSGRLTLTGANTYAGGTRIAGGTSLEIGEGGTAGSGTVVNDGLLAVNRASALTLDNRITGAGALLLDGGATLTLGADNDYAGGTDIRAGSTLQLGAGGTAGSLGQGDVALAGTLRVSRAEAVTLANRLAGAGTLEQAGAGTLTVTGNNALTGRTVVGPGTLVVGNGATSGAIGTGTIANAGTLRFNRSDDVVVGAAISGSGALEQAGTGTLRLLADNTYGGTTTISAGTLQVGAAGQAAGSLGSGAVIDNGVLRFERPDSVAVANTITGTGALEQTGAGTLTLSSTGNAYAGGTLVASGTLATAGADQLPDVGEVTVRTGAALNLGGAEAVGSLAAAGSVTIGGSLSATGRLVFGSSLKVAAGAPITLQGSEIVAENGDYDFGAQPLSLSGGSARLLSGSGALDAASGTTYRDLTLGAVTLSEGGRIDAGRLVLDGALRLTGATAALELRAHAAPTVFTLLDGLLGPNNELMSLSEAVITQNAGSVIDTVAGSTLAFKAVNGGSVHLEQDANSFLGGLSVLTGGADYGHAWQQNAAPGSPVTARQDEVRVAGSTIVVGGGSGSAVNGIEADVVYLRAGALRTEGPGLIAARLPYGNLTVGAAQSLPALTLELTDAAFTADTRYTFGNPNDDQEINVQVGNLLTGNRVGGINAGFVRVLPAGGARNGVAVYLRGPNVGTGGYRFFDSGAGKLSEIAVLYNGFSPASPQLQGSLSSVASVSEQARKERFEEAVRTENVAVRLRTGVIAEVGPGRPATQGTEGIRLPEPCSPPWPELACR